MNCQDVDRNNGKVGNTNLTVRLLVSCSGSGTTKLLGLVSPRVSDQQGPIKLDEDVLDLLLALLVNKLLVVGDQGLGEGLPDGVHLGHVSATLHTDADVNVSKPSNINKSDTGAETQACTRFLGPNGHTCPFQAEELAP